VILADNLSKRFGDFVAVDRVSFEVRTGEVFGFLGPNGAGKTTTIRMLCGILRPTSGRAVVAGTDVARDPERVKARIGYMSQRFTLYPDLTVSENIAFYGRVYGLHGVRLRDRTDRILGTLDLGSLRARLARDLAGGHRQRLALACAVLHEPPVLFLDEPTSGVDPAARRTFWDLIYSLAERGTTILVTTHSMDEAEYCERLAFIGSGRILACGTPSELKQTLTGFTTYRVQGAAGDRAIRMLREEPGVVSATWSGTDLHVVIRGHEDRVPDLQARMPGGTVQRIPPTLEDVFIHLAGQASGRA